jgi:hypothetical protein
MLRYLTPLVLLFSITSSISSTAQSQSADLDLSLKYAQNIDSFELKRHLFFLASDYLQGRETGSWGNNKAAKYAAHYFEKWGLEPMDEESDYFQKIPFTRFLPATTALQIEHVILEPYDDFVVSPFRQKALPDGKASEIHFAGYGLENNAYDDFGDFDWTDKVLIIFKTLPPALKKLTTEEERDIKERLKRCQEKGAQAILVIDEEFQSTSTRTRRYVDAQFLQLNRIVPEDLPLPPHAYVPTNLASAWLSEARGNFKKYRKRLLRGNGLSQSPLVIKKEFSAQWIPKVEYLESQNVAGYLPGTDSAFAGEHIVISAHYDHLGQRKDAVYNGADDNGSGTTTVLALAETFSKMKQEGFAPRRGLLFILMTGEEKGLLGSRYYSDHPLLPLEQAMANVNIDMVGRVDEKYSTADDYIYVIGADRISQDLHDVNEAANERGPNITLDYTYNEEDDPNRYYYRSDHYNFAKKGVPAIFFFNGTHGDYHGVGDSPDKIQYSAMQKRAQLIFLTAFDLMQRKEGLRINPSEE